MKLTDREIEIALRSGKAITREDRKNCTVYCQASLFMGEFIKWTDKNRLNSMILTIDDIYADDWEVIDK